MKSEYVTLTTSQPLPFQPGDTVKLKSWTNSYYDGSYQITDVKQNVHGVVPSRWYHHVVNFALSVFWKMKNLYWKMVYMIEYK